MNKRELQRYRKLIEAEKQRVLQRLGLIESDIQELARSYSVNTTYTNHMADVGTDAMENEQTFMHASQGTDYLVALDAALKRIEMGTYGVCEDCAGKIPPRRLDAYLAANLCVACKSKYEKLHRG